MTSPRVRLEPAPGGIAFYTPYDKDLVEAVKMMIPASDRSWDRVNSRWFIKAQHAEVCVTIAEMYLGVALTVPKAGAAAGVEMVVMEYLGRCQDKGSGSVAWGWAQDTWLLAFPEHVLRDWFSQHKASKPTLYSVLGAAKAATADDLKAAYRRMAKQWHPDVCHEPDATEQFKRIQHAWSMLSDPTSRRKYDTGLFFEQQASKVVEQPQYQPRNAWGRMLGIPDDYRAPLRCGRVTVEGEWRLGKLWVSKILNWLDVTDGSGRTMVSSWPAGATKFQVEWR